MKKQSRIFTLLAVVAMLFSLAGCNFNTSSATTKATTGKATDAITTTKENEVTTIGQTTVQPTTVDQQTTVAPTTVAPTTIAPTTVAPTTIVPTTVVPTTVAPTTVVPTTTVHVHSWGEGEVTTAATCTGKGVLTYTCECGETKTEEIEMVAHAYTSVEAKDPTYFTEGNKEYYVCDNCKNLFTKAEDSYTEAKAEDLVIAKLTEEE